MPGCFGCLGKKEQVFLRAVRDGNESVAHATLTDHPSLAKSVTLVDKKNALHLAAEEGHLVVLVAVLEILICQESVRSAENGDLPDDSDSIQKILNAQDARGQTPLFMAAALGHSDCARLLLTNGADRDIPDLRGNLPLHMAAWWGHLSIAFMLLDFALPDGQDVALSSRTAVNWGNAVGLTPLHLAVWGRRSGIMQILLQHDANINVRSGTQPQPDILLPCTSGSTPLHLAAARGSVEICKLLLKTHYERVVEPLLLVPGTTAASAAATIATADDPRMQTNDLMQMPYQIAQRMGFAPLAMLLRPTISLARLFGEIDRNTPRIYGASSLKTIATEAVNRKLAVTIQQLVMAAAESLEKKQRASEADLAASSASGLKQSQSRRTHMELIISADEDQCGPTLNSSTSARSPLHATSPSSVAPGTPGQVVGSCSGSRPASRASMLGGSLRSPARLGLPIARECTPSLPGMVSDEARGEDAQVLVLQAQMEQMMGPGSSQAVPPPASLAHTVDSPGTRGRLPTSPTEDIGAAIAAAPPQGPPAPAVSEVRPGSEDNSMTLSMHATARAPGAAAASVEEIGHAEEAEQEEEDEGGEQWNAKVVAGSTNARPSSGPDASYDSTDAAQRASDGDEGPAASNGAAATLASDQVEELLSQDVAAPPEGDIGRACCHSAGPATQGQGDEVTRVDGVAGPIPALLPDACDEECGVCLEVLPGLTIAPCKHLLCGACALKICTSDIKTPSLCPFCRSLIFDFGPV